MFSLHAGILTPFDEFQYWADVTESAEKNSVRERATHFTAQFKPLQKVCMKTFMCQEWLYEQNESYHIYSLLLYVYRMVVHWITVKCVLEPRAGPKVTQ